MRKRERPTLVKRVIAAAGSGAKLAAQLGIRRQAVYLWYRVPIEHVREVERITGIARHELRPDVYDAPETTTQQHAA